jgi:glycerol-3-phosphate dehydrogenase
VARVNRDAHLLRLRTAASPWDVVVVGGGATGLGCALDAASRGLATALFERFDFVSGTSSRSTKLIHGGVRYLRGGQVGLVAQSLRERERLLRNAPGLVREIDFLVPTRRFGARAFYAVGLGLYDALSGGAGATRVLSRAAVIERVPGLAAAGLRGGVLYQDNQFDDARLALGLARTAAEMGAAVVNYAAVEALLARDGRVAGVVVRDRETGAAFEVPARVVVNASGVNADAVRRMDDPAVPPIIRASRGTHIVLDRAFLPGPTAVLIPRTDDGRVLFLIPWRGRVLVGTTDTECDVDDDAVATPDDVAFLLSHAARVLSRPPSLADVTSAFAGLRPLLARATGGTASLSRDHRVFVSRRGLVTIAGGKWTTYRAMAEDAVDRAVEVGGLSAPRSRTATLALRAGAADPWSNDAVERAVMGVESVAGSSIETFVRDAVRDDMARTVEDVMARRSRALVLDARGSIAQARAVAAAMAAELARDGAWVEAEVSAFTARAARCIPSR